MRQGESRPRQAATSPGWIQSAPFDLALFTLSPLSGLFIVWAAYNLTRGDLVVLGATYLVAIPHYMSSFSFFLGDDNLAYYRTRRAAFFLGPAVIVSLVTGLRAIGFALPVLLAMFLWNIYHVARQSSGILAIYRRLGGGPPEELRLALATILSINAAMVFWHPDGYPPLYDTLIRIHPSVPWVLSLALWPVAAIFLSLWALQIYRRPRPMRFAEAAFLGTSLLLFHPYIWVRNADLATFAMLMGHFLQYLAIVWLLNRRKYAGSAGSVRQRFLGHITARPVFILMTIAGTGAVFFAFNESTSAIGHPGIYTIAWNALTLVHFYLDGLVWAFKRPYVQQSIGPYLTPPSHMVADS